MKFDGDHLGKLAVLAGVKGLPGKSEMRFTMLAYTTFSDLSAMINQ